MIRSFRVKNFRSIRDAQTVDLVVSRNATDLEGHFREIKNGDRVPTVVAVYGHNGSGKTCLLKVPMFLAEFLTNSFLEKAENDIPVSPFLAPNTINQPTEFAISFDLTRNEQWVTYRYEVTLSKKKVFSEALYYRPERKERLLFERRATETPDAIALEMGPDFEVNQGDPMISKVKDKASVISTFAQFNHRISKELIAASTAVFSNVWQSVGRVDYISEFFASQIYKGNEYTFSNARNFLREADLGIEDIELHEQKSVTEKGEQTRIYPTFKHRGLSIDLPFNDESHGTQALYRVLPYILSALQSGGTAIIDELDADIHPKMMPRLLELFHLASKNKKNAQFFLSGHNAYTLSFLEKEEVYFSEKDETGVTTIFGLRDKKGVRRADNFFLKYLAGEFGAIPR